MTRYIKEGIMYQRKGKCKRCGECCKNEVTYFTEDNIVLSVGIAKIKNSCVCLIENNVCVNHINKTKSMLCRKYPLMKEETDLFHNCGYYWEEIKKTNKSDSKIYIKKQIKNVIYYKIKE